MSRLLVVARRTALTLLMVGTIARGVASAQVTPAAGYTPPDDTQSIKVGAVIYTDYTYTKAPTTKDADGNTISPSSFNVTRSYINVTGNLSHVVAFRITPDVTRDTDAGALNGNMVFRIKYAFAQFNLDDWTGDWKGTWVRLGIQQTPYVDFMEGIYRYRFQGTTFTEREQVNGVNSSSDAGASFHTGLPNNYGEIHAGFYNGENYTKADPNDQKAFMIRATFRPLATSSSTEARGLRVHFFYDGDHYVRNAERKRFVFTTTYEGKRLSAGVDYLDGKDQTSITAPDVQSKGWSFWVTPFFKEKGNGFEALIRYDHFKPNVTTLDSQIRTRFIGGIAYWFPHPGGPATAALLLDYEQVKFDNFPAAPANATQERIALHGLINF
jgi:hypothetical protein